MPRRSHAGPTNHRQPSNEPHQTSEQNYESFEKDTGDDSNKNNETINKPGDQNRTPSPKARSPRPLKTPTRPLNTTANFGAVLKQKTPVPMCRRRTAQTSGLISIRHRLHPTLDTASLSPPPSRGIETASLARISASLPWHTRAPAQEPLPTSPSRSP